MRNVSTPIGRLGLSFEVSTLLLLIATAALLFAMFGADRLHGSAVETAVALAFFFVLPIFSVVGLLLSGMNLFRSRRFQFGVEVVVALMLIWMVATAH